MGSLMALPHVTFSDPESQGQGRADFKALYRTGALLGPMLLLHMNKKPYMGSPMEPSHLILNDLERSNSISPRFQSLISRKEA